MRSREETSARMLEYRREHNIKIEEMARDAHVSTGLLTALEYDDWITHPHIASRVCEAYGLDVDDYNNLVNEAYYAKKLPKPVQPPKTSNMYA